MKLEEARLLDSVADAARELPGSVIDELCGALAGLVEDAPPRQRASLAGQSPLLTPGPASPA